MAIDDALNRLVDRLPYSDGSSRRRFIAGTVIALGIAIPNWSRVSEFTGFGFSDFVQTPMLAAAVGLLIYLAGTVVEMVGGLFLVPAAALILRPLSRLAAIADDRDLALHLSMAGRATFSDLPERVRMGIEHRASRHADLAIQFLPRLFATSQNRRWCRQAFSRAMDVGATTTALIGVVIAVAVFSVANSGDTPVTRYWRDATSVQRAVRAWSVVAGRMGEMLRDAADLPMEYELPELDDKVFSLEASDLDPLDAYFTARDAGETIGYFQSAQIELFTSSIERLAKYPRDQFATNIERLRGEIGTNYRPLVREDVIKRAEQLTLNAEKESFENLQKALAAWKQSAAEVQSLRDQQRGILILLGATFPALLLFYIGYFLSLRNAFINSIEARAIELANVGSDVQTTAQRDKPLSVA